MSGRGAFPFAGAVRPLARAEGPAFREPWEAQAFAIVLALAEAKLFTWSEWTAALAREIAAASRKGDREADDAYYRHWLAALERLVVEKGVATAETLDARKAAWARAEAATPHGAPILLANDPGASS